MKRVALNRGDAGRKSRPAGARGLKPLPSCCTPLRGQVAPRGGARIETGAELAAMREAQVAPRGGARIETASGGSAC